MSEVLGVVALGVGLGVVVVLAVDAVQAILRWFQRPRKPRRDWDETDEGYRRQRGRI